MAADASRNAPAQRGPDLQVHAALRTGGLGMKKVCNPLLPGRPPLLNARVVRGALARLFDDSRVLPRLLGLVLLLPACSSDTRVRLLLRTESEAFRPDHVDIYWGLPDTTELRTARIPATGSLPTTGSELGSVLITLSQDAATDRRFLARGWRGETRVSGATATVPWRAGSESTVTMTLECFDDPDYPEPLPGCPAPQPDAGTGDDAHPSDGHDGGAVDAASDRPRG